MFTVSCIRYIQSEQFLAIANQSGLGSTLILSWSFSPPALLGIYQRTPGIEPEEWHWKGENKNS